MQTLQQLRDSVPPHLALTGRVKSWLSSDESRLPASCTVFSVEDYMEGKNGIEDSWLFTSHGLRNAAGVAIDLSKLRPNGSDNGKGLVSSGAVHFGTLYSNLNGVLRRGGTFRNGAITLYLDHDHPDCEEFLNAPPADFPWAKRAVYIDHTIFNNPLLPLIAEKVNQGTVWLAKKQYDEKGDRLYSNVCLEVLLQSRGTCLLSHVNVGALKPTELKKAFVDSMHWLCQLHAVTGVADSGYYLDPENDRQVGLGVIGFANFLAINRCKYAQFTSDLLSVLSGARVEGSLARYLYDAYMAAGKVAKSYKMLRAFVVAPTANSHRSYTDLDGFTCAAEISAPLDYAVDRDSGIHGVETYEFHPKTEIAKEVGWDTHWQFLEAYQSMMDATGVSHSISANIWSTCKVTERWIKFVFMPSPLKTTYYRLSVDQDALNKSEIMLKEDLDMDKEVYDSDTSTGCSVSRVVDDPNYCEACGG